MIPHLMMVPNLKCFQIKGISLRGNECFGIRISRFKLGINRLFIQLSRSCHRNRGNSILINVLQFGDDSKKDGSTSDDSSKSENGTKSNGMDPILRTSKYNNESKSQLFQSFGDLWISPGLYKFLSWGLIDRLLIQLPIWEAWQLRVILPSDFLHSFDLFPASVLFDIHVHFELIELYRVPRHNATLFTRD